MLIDFRHLFKALLYSFDGLKRAWQGEQAFRFEVLLVPIIVIALFVIKPGAGWCAALMAGWLLVMALELLNSAVEEICDLVSPDYNIHVKYSKDMASAAIFVALCINAVLWLFMLWERFFSA